MRKLNLLAVGATVALLTAASAAGAQTYSNGPNSGNISSFGFPDTQTYGEVFTAQTSGNLSSFSMFLGSAIGGTLYGGIGAWNCGASYAANCGESSALYDSSPVAADHAGTYTFAPNVALTAGSVYVAYLSVFGANNSGQSTTSMPLGSGGGGFDYFVFNNSNNGPHSSNWNYFSNFGNARLDLTFEPSAGGVPEPTSWALMLLGFGGLGAVLRSSRRNGAVLAA